MTLDKEGCQPTGMETSASRLTGPASLHGNTFSFAYLGSGTLVDARVVVVNEMDMTGA